jgi:ABC transporter, phosphonate, periplasmic substrate-binding protein
VRAQIWVVVAVVLGCVGGRAVAEGAADSVGVLVLKEHGVSSPTLVQPYLDRFVALAARLNGWPGAVGQYHATRASAEAFIQAAKPHYGILSLPAFLAFRKKYKLDVIGQVSVSLAGGRQYSIISRTATDLAGCKGKVLATDHADDPRFIDRVVFAGTFKLSDFTVEQTQRPLQTIKAMIRGSATCALVDDSQLEQLSHIEGAEGIRPVWQSAQLPQMVVVAFPSAPAAERRRFQDKLADVCDNDGQTACGEVGIQSLTAAKAADYSAVVAAYGS